ncbi:alcohol dehydrogenase family protein [Yoonia sp. 208BN28-4]|uniref:alcohol dehydrogenase family protein n=1 Tax=Yoonia sp. 208BN28-4 TaxID=3126505 RepID=UPI0030AB537D
MSLPTVMSGVVLTGYGGLDCLEWRDDLPVPQVGPDDVLIRVAAAGVNNTDINTRTGWYAKSVTAATSDDVRPAIGEDGTWSGDTLTFPHIQGADCCGHIVAVGDNISADRIGQRVLTRTMRNTTQPDGTNKVVTQGSETQGAFAQYMAAPSFDAITVAADWTDIELASIPCAYTTAEGMLARCNLGAETVLITGASGGVGSALIQLAKRRGATVTAVTQADKAAALQDIGADHTLDHDAPLPENHYDVVLDLVAGARFPDLLDALKPQGRYVTSGAIAGPMVTLDVRTLYLKDLTLIGSTAQPAHILPAIVSYIAAGTLKPLVSAVFPLNDIAAAQQAFMAKTLIGKIVLDVTRPAP